MRHDDALPFLLRRSHFRWRGVQVIGGCVSSFILYPISLNWWRQGTSINALLVKQLPVAIIVCTSSVGACGSNLSWGFLGCTSLSQRHLSHYLYVDHSGVCPSLYLPVSHDFRQVLFDTTWPYHLEQHQYITTINWSKTADTQPNKMFPPVVPWDGVITYTLFRPITHTCRPRRGLPSSRSRFPRTFFKFIT